MTGYKAFVFIGLRPGMLSKAKPPVPLGFTACHARWCPAAGGEEFVTLVPGFGWRRRGSAAWSVVPDQGAGAVLEKKPLRSSFAQGAGPPAENRGCTSRGPVRSVLP